MESLTFRGLAAGAVRTWIDDEPPLTDAPAAADTPRPFPITTSFHGTIDGLLLGMPHQHIAVLERLACIDDLMQGLLALMDEIHPSRSNNALSGVGRAAAHWRSETEFYTGLAAYKSLRSNA